MKTAFSNIVRTAIIASVLTVGFGFLPLQPANVVMAIGGDQERALGIDKLQGENIGGAGTNATFDPYKVASNIVNLLLSFLGIIAVGIILYAGFKWMTAGGKDEQVTEAQTMLMQGVVGLVIVIAAWGIATWVIGQLAGVVTNNT